HRVRGGARRRPHGAAASAGRAPAGADRRRPHRGGGRRARRAAPGEVERDGAADADRRRRAARRARVHLHRDDAGLARRRPPRRRPRRGRLPRRPRRGRRRAGRGRRGPRPLRRGRPAPAPARRGPPHPRPPRGPRRPRRRGGRVRLRPVRDRRPRHRGHLRRRGRPVRGRPRPRRAPHRAARVRPARRAAARPHRRRRRAERDTPVDRRIAAPPARRGRAPCPARPGRYPRRRPPRARPAGVPGAGLLSLVASVTLENPVLTMQDALIRLTGYWAERGCLVAQPMNTEVGAGTLNPATALRVLGPEPWRVAYPEPSVRPDDARYGDNPNRLQTHTQFQVILKPEPGDAQELYLGSLAALGIDLRAHDVRFVEDDWASPALGAWGLGWEVWLDGLEITQFTYFQQSGGLTLDPVSVEITYGMERILMALQGVSHFKDIAYAPGISYGEAFGQAEYEMSRYYLDDADIETNRELFEAYAAEARRMLDARLPVPAHTYVLKCSHAFNVLDSRGAIGTTERARAFARMRGLAHEAAALWVERRAELGHPLGDAAVRPAAEPAPAALPALDAPGTFALEIGVAELPPPEVSRTADDVAERLRRGLEEAGLFTGASSLDAYATPRRIIVVVRGLDPREPDTEQVVKGPRFAAAYDESGAPTRALQGFARGHGIDVADVRKLTVGGGEDAGSVRTVVGRQAAEVLADLAPEIVTGLRAGKNMRWNAPGLSFARPIRWLLALLDGHEVPLAVSGLTAGRTTRVHRTAAEPAVDVPDAASLVAVLREHGIEPDPARRRARVVEDAGALARARGGVIDFAGEEALVEEIVNLVEEPVAVLGAFDEKYLELPQEILTTVMRKHQRYLPVRTPDGGLMPCFVAVANGECDHDA